MPNLLLTGRLGIVDTRLVSWSDTSVTLVRKATDIAFARHQNWRQIKMTSETFCMASRQRSCDNGVPSFESLFLHL